MGKRPRPRAVCSRVRVSAHSAQLLNSACVVGENVTCSWPQPPPMGRWGFSRGASEPLRGEAPPPVPSPEGRRPVGAAGKRACPLGTPLGPACCKTMQSFSEFSEFVEHFFGLWVIRRLMGSSARRAESWRASSSPPWSAVASACHGVAFAKPGDTAMDGREEPSPSGGGGKAGVPALLMMNNCASREDPGSRNAPRGSHEKEEECCSSPPSHSGAHAGLPFRRSVEWRNRGRFLHS